MTQVSHKTELGLRPRLIAAGWFAATACVPIIAFFGLIGRIVYLQPSDVAEPIVASAFVFLPISMAAFFGFLTGSSILNESVVRGSFSAATRGALVAILSYFGFALAYGSVVVFQTSRNPDALAGVIKVFLIGAVLVGWLIVITGALGGWLLFQAHRRWAFSTPASRNLSGTRPLYLNLGAVVVLAIVLFLCWLPINIWARREHDKQQLVDFFEAIYQNRVADVKKLLAIGISPDTEDVTGSTTPLLMAAENGETRIVSILLQYGANANGKTDRSGQTPLHLAVSNFDQESIKALVDHGANVNATDRNGRTAVMLAASTADAETVRFLIQRGANVEWKDNYGDTALSLARRDRDLTGTRDRIVDRAAAERLDAGRSYGDSRDLQNPIVMKRARDRHDAIIELLKSYGLK
jgi:Ankyrin repeats (3 copies)/Ankyrin repeat